MFGCKTASFESVVVTGSENAENDPKCMSGPPGTDIVCYRKREHKI